MAESYLVMLNILAFKYTNSLPLLIHWLAIDMPSEVRTYRIDSSKMHQVTVYDFIYNIVRWQEN